MSGRHFPDAPAPSGSSLVTPLAASLGDVATGANTNETVLKSVTLPANTLNADGQYLHVRAWGRFANTANGKTVRLRLGNVTLLGTVMGDVSGALQAQEWAIDAVICRDASGSQVSAFDFYSSTAAGGTQNQEHDAASGSEDDSSVLVLELTGQNAAAAANDIVATGFLVSLVEAP